MEEAGIPVPNNWRRISYFHCSLLGYFLGLLTATVSSEVKQRLRDFDPISLRTLIAGFQSCPTRFIVSGSIHTFATLFDGLPKRRPENHVA